MRKNQLNQFIVYSFILFTASTNALGADSECAKSTYLAEKQFDQGSMDQSQETIQKAVSLCDKDKNEKSARPYILYGKILFEKGSYNEAIVQFEKGLTKQPNLGLAYMNISASYIYLKDWDKAITAGKKAVQMSDSSIEAKSNFNLGLAYFNKAANGDTNKVIEAEPYFQKVAKLMPGYGQVFYYLGLIQDSGHQNPTKALEFYQKACNLKWQDACAEKTVVETKINSAKLQKEADAKYEQDLKEREKHNAEIEAQNAKNNAPPVETKAPETENVPLPPKVRVPASETAQFDEYEANLIKVKEMKPEKARKRANKDWSSLDNQTDPSMRKAYIDSYLKLSRVKP